MAPPQRGRPSQDSLAIAVWNMSLALMSALAGLLRLLPGFLLSATLLLTRPLFASLLLLARLLLPGTALLLLAGFLIGICHARLLFGCWEISPPPSKRREFD
jgi:hypothetical protein